MALIWVLYVGSLLAIVFGVVALRQIKRTQGQGGRGLAISGILIGVAALLVLAVVTYVAAASAHSTTGAVSGLASLASTLG